MIVGRGVEKVEGRCGGQAVLVGTRLTIRCLDAMWQSGGDALVAKEYPYLTREQRFDAYGYAEEHRAELDAELAKEVVGERERTLPETDEDIRAELAKASDAPPDLVRRLERLQVEHDAMASAGRQAHDECVTAQRRAARAIAALRLLQSGLVSLPDKVQSAVSVALSDEPPPPRVSVRDIGVGGPYRLFVDDWGIATWPSKPSLEDPHGYAEEVARCLRRALGVVE